MVTIRLVKKRSASAPPRHEHGQTDGLEDAGKGADGNGVERALLSEDLRNELCPSQQMMFFALIVLKLTDGAELAMKIKVPI